MATPADLDAADPLARFRDEFHLPPSQIYLDGNSLGLLSRRAEAGVVRVLAEWAAMGIGGWTEGDPPWLTLADKVAARLAPLLGAEPESIALTGQTTANLHQLLATLFDPGAPRRKILADPLNFASDLHALRSHLRLRGFDPETDLVLVPSRDGLTLSTDDIVAAMTPDIQLAVLPAALFTSGQLLDLTLLARAAHARGVVIGFDCSHSVGAVPHFLDRDGVDFAFWCDYKYLNGGPGAIGGLYLNRRHFHRPPGLAGWWGVCPGRRFSMQPHHERAAGAAGLQIGTPPILSLAPLQGSLEIIEEAGGMEALRKRSLALTGFLMKRLDELPAEHGFSIATPRQEAARGGHVALVHGEAWRICQALKAAGVIPDFRPPNIIRMAPSPLYSTFTDCAEAVVRLREIMRSRSFLLFPDRPALVT